MVTNSKEIIAKLQEYTNHKHIKLTKRGNKSILYAFQIAKNLGKTKILIPDQGGWITYRQYPDKLELEKTEYETDYGIIKLNKIQLDSSCAIIVNNLAAYAFPQPLELLYNMCNNANTILILDASGSIGTKACKGTYADITLGSFGKDKPINLGTGGFISVLNEYYFEKIEIEEPDLNLGELLHKLNQLTHRQHQLRELSQKVKQELKNKDIIHRDKEGINVIVRFKNDNDKQQIINYCIKNKLEFTECPRDIRVNAKAISIEIKRQ